MPGFENDGWSDEGVFNDTAHSPTSGHEERIA